MDAGRPDAAADPGQPQVSGAANPFEVYWGSCARQPPYPEPPRRLDPSQADHRWDAERLHDVEYLARRRVDGSDDALRDGRAGQDRVCGADGESRDRDRSDGAV